MLDQANQREILDKYKQSMMHTIMEEDDEASDRNIVGSQYTGTAIKGGLKHLDDDDEDEAMNNEGKGQVK